MAPLIAGQVSHGPPHSPAAIADPEDQTTTTRRRDVDSAAALRLGEGTGPNCGPRQPTSLGLPCRHLQSLPAPRPLYSLVVCILTTIPQQSRDSPVPVPAESTGQLPDLSSEQLVISRGSRLRLSSPNGPWWWHFPCQKPLPDTLPDSVSILVGQLPRFLLASGPKGYTTELCQGSVAQIRPDIHET